MTTARLADHSDDGVRAAVRDAVETAVRGARAMGLSHVALQDVSRLDDETVAIRLVASDAEGDEPDGSQPAGHLGPRLGTDAEVLFGTNRGIPSPGRTGPRAG